MILSRVDFPAPLSPTTAWTSIGFQLEIAVLQRDDTGEVLVEVARLEAIAGTHARRRGCRIGMLPFTALRSIGHAPSSQLIRAFLDPIWPYQPN